MDRGVHGEPICDSASVVRLFWPRHLRRTSQPQWLVGWADASQSRTLDRPQQLLTLVVAGALQQATAGGDAGPYLRPGK